MVRLVRASLRNPVLVPLHALEQGGARRRVRDPRARRGRTLAEILDDPYIRNRLTTRAARAPARPARDRARASARTDRRRAPSSNVARARARRRARARARRARADRDVPRGEPVRLEDDDVVVGLAARHLAGDDLLQLVHLEPVEDAAPRPARSGRPTRCCDCSSESQQTNAARSRTTLSSSRAARVVRADGADERARPQPLAAQHRVASRSSTVTTTSCSAASRWTLAGSAPCSLAERARAAPRSGSRRRRARSSAGPRGCTRPASPPASRSRSPRASPRRRRAR